MTPSRSGIEDGIEWGDYLPEHRFKDFPSAPAANGAAGWSTILHGGGNELVDLRRRKPCLREDDTYELFGEVVTARHVHTLAAACLSHDYHAISLPIVLESGLSQAIDDLLTRNEHELAHELREARAGFPFGGHVESRRRITRREWPRCPSVALQELRELTGLNEVCEQKPHRFVGTRLQFVERFADGVEIERFARPNPRIRVGIAIGVPSKLRLDLHDLDLLCCHGYTSHWRHLWTRLNIRLSEQLVSSCRLRQAPQRLMYCPHSGRYHLLCRISDSVLDWQS